MVQTTIRRSAIFLKTRAKYNVKCGKCRGQVVSGEKCIEWKNRDGATGTICNACIKKVEEENKAKIARIIKREENANKRTN
jgi:hypothetical protein